MITQAVNGSDYAAGYLIGLMLAVAIVLALGAFIWWLCETDHLPDIWRAVVKLWRWLF